MKRKNKKSSGRMHFFLVSLILLFQASLMFAQQEKEAVSSNPPANAQWVLVVHGGAGGPPKGTFRPEEEKAYLDNLDTAMMKGALILEKGGSSLDAVEAVIRYLEDCPLFNAGKGAVLSELGIAELDASIMDGKTLKAGAVAGVTTIKNPVSAARKVMENSPHVMLINGGAESFAKDQGLEIVDPSYFITDKMKEKWEKSKNKDPKPDNKKGTVGAVALDQNGNLAAATSTGGMMNKMHGRVGDSPIIGAGTYANNKTCAVSCTGHGEYFIRNVVAYDVSVMMEYQGLTLEEAANKVIWEKLKPQGGDGGLIAVDRDGQIAMPYNSNAMFRGYIRAGGLKEVLIY
jgi:L-asparaginase / beta-aspartyl-peptidase